MPRFTGILLHFTFDDHQCKSFAEMLSGQFQPGDQVSAHASTRWQIPKSLHS
jgi:hypothetical protein